MRLVTYEDGFGRVDGDRIIPMGADLRTYLVNGTHEDGAPVELASVKLHAPVPNPSKVIGIGLNYRDFAELTGQQIPELPILFPKFANSIIGPGDPIIIPPMCGQPDYEAELAVVIGRAARNVTAEEALEYVAGYTCANDVTARDMTAKAGQWLWGKAIDSFLPMGPWLVTPDELEPADPQQLDILCTLNGEVMIDSTTRHMNTMVAGLIAHLSQIMTLVPGDVLLTGTPAGVGLNQDPPRWLRPGDEVTISIQGIGDLTNTVAET